MNSLQTKHSDDSHAGFSTAERLLTGAIVVTLVAGILLFLRSLV
jgi:hypothetical protein